MTLQTTLPISAVAAIVARFDRDLTEVHFHGNDVKVRINEAHLNSDGAWRVAATHISGEDMLITLTRDATADFGWHVDFSVLYQGVWFPSLS